MLASMSLETMAGPTRLELATSCVTGRRSNRLNYGPGREINDLAYTLVEKWFCKFSIQRKI